MRELRSKIHRFVRDNKDPIRESRPELDRELINNRQRDNATMLLQIADTIGPRCGERAREAIKRITGGDILDANEMLLGDIASILTDPEIVVGDPAKPIGAGNCVFSGDLCDLIGQYFPHREAYVGFTQARLAAMLSRFDIAPEPRCKRRGKSVLHWYRRDAFDEWFVRYGLVEPADETVVDPMPEGAADDISAEPATPLPKEADCSSVAAADANVATGCETTGDGRSNPPTPGQPPEPEPVADAYPNAKVVEPKRGDKKRLDRLRRAVDAFVRKGRVQPENVVFVSSDIWIVRNDNGCSLARINGSDELSLLRIEPPGLVAHNDEGVIVNGEVTLSLTETDYMRVRPLVNKARKVIEVLGIAS
jgi:hypothetical protein